MGTNYRRRLIERGLIDPSIETRGRPRIPQNVRLMRIWEEASVEERAAFMSEAGLRVDVLEVPDSALTVEALDAVSQEAGLRYREKRAAFIAANEGRDLPGRPVPPIPAASSDPSEDPPE